jgi:hypothetical protein
MRFILLGFIFFPLALVLMLTGCQPATTQIANPNSPPTQIITTTQIITPAFVPSETPSPVQRITPTPTPTLSPTAEPAPPMSRLIGFTYDRMRDELLAFGGLRVDVCDPCGETWIWDGASWTKRKPANSPNPRIAPSMAYNEDLGVVTLFGGASPEVSDTGEWKQIVLNDTWLWDGTDWIQVSPAISPSPRMDAKMAFDAANEIIVLFGGTREEKGDIRFLDETWTWDGQIWQQHPSGALSNGAIPQPSMTYDAARQRVMLWQYSTGLWSWEGDRWMNLLATDGPDTYLEGVLGYDETHKMLVLWGRPSLFDSPESWTWDGKNWVEIDTSTSPGPNSPEAWMVYDEKRQSLLLITADNDVPPSAWEWKENGWEPMEW